MLRMYVQTCRDYENENSFSLGTSLMCAYRTPLIFPFWKKYENNWKIHIFFKSTGNKMCLRFTYVLYYILINAWFLTQKKNERYHFLIKMFLNVITKLCTVI